jgi:hypothetical protein
MAAEVTVLSLHDHCRRRAELYVEDQLAELAVGFDDSAPARLAAAAVDAELFRHIEQVLELWQQPHCRPGDAGDAY